MLFTAIVAADTEEHRSCGWDETSCTSVCSKAMMGKMASNYKEWDNRSPEPRSLSAVLIILSRGSV